MRRAATMVGELSVAQLAALLAHGAGPGHQQHRPGDIAAAVGTPVVDLYALTNPQHTPWAVPSRVLFHDVPCKFCYRSVCPELHHDCLRKVSRRMLWSSSGLLANCTARMGTLAGIEVS